MGSINEFIKANAPKTFKDTKKCHISPEIPTKCLSNAVSSFSFEGQEGAVLLLIDTTIRGNGSAGLLMSGEQLIHKRGGGDPVAIRFDEIDSVLYEKRPNAGFTEPDEALIIKKRDGATHEITNLFHVELENFEKFLRNIVEDFEEYSEQEQLLPISDLSEDLKSSYIKVIANMAFDRDGHIDDDEFSELLHLLSRLEVETETREHLREYFSSGETQSSTEGLIQSVKEEAPDGMKKSVQLSLAKDLINVHSSLTQEVSKNFPFLEENKQHLDLSEGELDLAVTAIETDKKLLDRSYTDDEVTKSLKELSAKASAVGVPLGAVYLSGSVVGLSAAGMTSGLATLGMGGMLGLSSMATGIGAAVVLGVVAYKGVRSLANRNIDESDKRREVMLQEVIRQGQKTTSMVIEDINVLSDQLTEATSKANQNEEKINALATKLKQYTNASKKVAKGTEKANRQKERLNCPEFIEVPRLADLAKDDAATKHYQIILQSYEPYGESANTSKTNKEEFGTLRLRDDPSEQELQKLAASLEQIGYHNINTTNLKSHFRRGRR